MKNCDLIDILREPKIFNMAIFDWILTLLGSYAITWLLYKFNDIDISFTQMYVIITIGLVIIGIILHKILNVPTMLGYYLGLNKKPKRIKCI